jgi:glucose-6-phosphate 1-dehydrogenase
MARPRQEEAVRVFYLAVAPSLFGAISDNLDSFGLVNELSRVVLEKPIGHDLASARAVNDAVGQVFDESQIFRIDHFLGKESVQNLLVTRFANTFLEPLWNSHWVDHVQITVAESLGIGDRGGYYDHSGALRDMVQNHLLQLLCLVAMEPPTYIGRETVRDEKLKVLQALKPMSPIDVDRDTVRGRYTEGLVDGAAVTSYSHDLGYGGSRTETFVAMRTEVQNWRWTGVPFYLRTGKRMDRRASEIVVVFKQPAKAMFPHSEGSTEPNRLHIQVQPDEGMRLHLTAKEPGPGGIRLRPVSLDLSYATTFDQRLPDAYERLLMDVIRGNPTLFMRRDEVEAAWTWVEPILTRWATSPDRPKRYPAGTSGPTAAATLLDRDGRSWQESDS